MTGQRYAGKVVRVLQFYFLLLLLFTIYRAVLIFISNIPVTDLSDLLVTGLRFDSRWAGLFTMPLVCLSLLQIFFRKANFTLIQSGYATLVLLLVLLLCIVDYYYYRYTSTRLSPFLLEIITPLSVAVKMAWQSYPVLLLSLLLLIVMVVLNKFVVKKIVSTSGESRFSVKELLLHIAVLMLCLLTVWGTLKRYPLTWSDAFHQPQTGVLALNPAESFFYGLLYKEETAPDPSYKDYQLAENIIRFDSVRAQQVNAVKNKFAAGSTKMNVVVILAESLSSYKTSLVPGQALNPTPFLKTIADSSYFFPNCFTPHYGTARAVWNLFTGMPDVNWNRLATHQLPSAQLPVLLDQMQFSKKYYLLGGDGTWADIKGFLKANIDGLQVLDQSQMKANPVSVWGVDDYDLLMQANDQFAATDSPFFAVVQTASNHKPYVIPPQAQKLGFELKTQPAGVLQKFGFVSNAEYNAVRYLDFCLTSFFKKAAASTYFSNTLFIIVGDHGTVGNASVVLHPDWDTYKLNMLHVPLLFYKQGAIAQMDSTLCGIQDILPTVYGLRNNTNQSGIRGIDLFSGYYKTGQFYLLQDLRQMGWVTPAARFLASYNSGKLQNILTNQPASSSDSLTALVLAAYKVYAAKNHPVKK